MDRRKICRTQRGERGKNPRKGDKKKIRKEEGQRIDEDGGRPIKKLKGISPVADLGGNCFTTRREGLGALRRKIRDGTQATCGCD